VCVCTENDDRPRHVIYTRSNKARAIKPSRKTRTPVAYVTRSRRHVTVGDEGGGAKEKDRLTRDHKLRSID